MELQRDWGKAWTYLFVVLIMLAIAGFGWYLVEEKRDQNANVFYDVSKENYNQIETIRSLVSLMADSDYKTELMGALDKTKIIRTRAEMDSIIAERDSILNIPVDTVVVDTPQDPEPPSAPIFVLSDVNVYQVANAGNISPENASTDGWVSVNGGRLSVHQTRTTSGEYAIEIDGATGGVTGAMTTLELDSGSRYQLSLDIRKNATTVASLSLENPDGSIMGSYEIPTGAEFESFEFVINGKSTAILKALFLSPSKSGEEIYIDKMALRKYEKL